MLILMKHFIEIDARNITTSKSESEVCNYDMKKV